MRPRTYLAYFLALSLLMFVPLSAFGAGGIVVAPPKKNYQMGQKYPDVALKFVKSGEQMAGGHKRLAALFTPVTGPGRIIVYVPFKDKTTENNEEIEATVNHLREGDVVEADLEKENGMFMLTKAKLIEVKPGEETPHGYVYQESYNDQNNGLPLVRLTKYGQSTEVIVYTTRDESGKLQPDPDLINTVNSLKAGTLVYADIVPRGNLKVLTMIFPFREPQQGKVTAKPTEQTLANGKTESVDIETSDGKTVTALVPGRMIGKKWVVDSNLFREVHSLKPGAEVVFLARPDDGKSFLVQISPAPKTDSHSTGSSSGNR